MVTAEIKRTAKKHEDRIHQHSNVGAIQLLDNERTVGRLKRLKPFEVVHVSVNSAMGAATMC
jgi:hypothetical protein